MLIKHEPKYKNHYWAEQQVLIDAYPQIKHLVKLVPMRHMNSLQMKLYNSSDSMYQVPYDTVDGFNLLMEWQPEDWIVHWPGTSNTVRLKHAKEMMENIYGVQE